MFVAGVVSRVSDELAVCVRFEVALEVIEPSLAGGATGGSIWGAVAVVDATDVEVVMAGAAGTAATMTLSGLGSARDAAGVEVEVLLA